ncbi:ABC transporter permease [Parabacteroides sp. OttesenSCG-928-J18]|nr:ABC transporter permease [Parabacteroides sp. OttesenSCG-928-J18]
MLKIYIKQAFQLCKENPLVSTISIIGSAISIAMIMVVVLVFQIRYANFPPEDKRDRMMYVHGTHAASDGNNNNGGMSVEVVKECFYALQTPEAVSASYKMLRPLSLPAKRLYKEYSISLTDPAFWKIFSFRFIEGKPFTEADFQSGIRTAVVSEELARDLFGTTAVVGETIISDFLTFTICGVVRDVSLVTSDAYAHMWIPYTTDEGALQTSKHEGISGVFRVDILAHKQKDFNAIREELTRRTAQYNETKKDFTVSFLDNPITRLDVAMGSHGFKKANTVDFLLSTGGILLFLILIPAFNLTGVAQSSVQQRHAEVGVRKAFGATGGKIIHQVIYENLITTLTGGVIGFFLSFLLLYLCRSFLLDSSPALNTSMLFKPFTFAVALLFVLLLNLLSAIIPAVRISRLSTVDALRDDTV